MSSEVELDRFLLELGDRRKRLLRLVEPATDPARSCTPATRAGVHRV